MTTAQPTATVLVVDDDVDLARSLVRLLKQAGYDAHAAHSAEEARAALEAKPVELVLSDLRMPGADGMQLLTEVRERWPGVQVVLLTGHGTVPLAVQAMRAGAADFLLKPPQREELLFALRKALALAPAQEPAQTPAPEREEQHRSPAMQKAYAALERAAATDATVLLRGESGTGKEVAARWLHARSARRDGPFVAVHCAALPDALLESELFGYERGAFTGATTRKPGRVELAQGGTLLLDEVGDLTPSVQVKLLRLVQERTYERLGGTQTLTAAVRFVAATHRDLGAMVARGEFREDLFYRLDVVPVWLPPLRERGAELELLAKSFFEDAAQRHGRASLRLEEGAVRVLRAQPWPGNVRQLQNFVERLVVLSEGSVLDASAVERELGRPAVSGPREAAAEGSLEQHRREAEKAAVEQALERAGNNRVLAARLLGVSRRTLYYKLREFGIA